MIFTFDFTFYSNAVFNFSVLLSQITADDMIITADNTQITADGGTL